MKHTAVTIRHEATGIAELVGFYRLARDMCARGGLPDWGEMVFTLECEFQSVRVLSDEQSKALQAELDDLDMGGRLVVKDF